MIQREYFEVKYSVSVPVFSMLKGGGVVSRETSAQASSLLSTAVFRYRCAIDVMRAK
jgi:hypothetical protein